VGQLLCPLPPQLGKLVRSPPRTPCPYIRQKPYVQQSRLAATSEQLTALVAETPVYVELSPHRSEAMP
jgi:hypothetical protein